MPTAPLTLPLHSDDRHLRGSGRNVGAQTGVESLTFSALARFVQCQAVVGDSAALAAMACGPDVV